MAATTTLSLTFLKGKVRNRVRVILRIITRKIDTLGVLDYSLTTKASPTNIKMI